MLAYRVLLVRHGIERSLLGRHLVYEENVVNASAIEPGYYTIRTQNVVVGIVFLPDQSSQCLLAFRTQVLVGVGLGSVLFDPTAIDQELNTLRIWKTQGLIQEEKVLMRVPQFDGLDLRKFR